VKHTLFALLFLLGASFPLIPQEAAPEPDAAAPSPEPDAPLMEGEGLTYEEYRLTMESQGITVLGAAETTQQMDVITKDEIERRNAPDLPTLLEETLNLGVTRYGAYGNQADINIRGFDSERVAILINGIPANSPRTGEFDMTQIDINSIERIEVIYGGSDTKYNVTGALGGVINLITLRKQPLGLRLGGSISNSSVMPGRYNKKGGEVGGPQWQDLADTQMTSLFAGYGAEKYSLSFNWFGNRAANHYLYKDYYGFSRRKENNEVWDTGLSGSYLREFDLTKLLVSVDGYYADRNFPVTGTALSKGKQRDFKTGQSLMLDMPRAFHDSLAMEASLSHSWAFLDYEGISVHQDNNLTAINRWTWFPFPWMTFRAGFDYRYIHIDSTEDGVRNGHNGGLYLTAEWQPHQRFLIVPSVKGVSNGADIVPAPKLGFVWSPVDAFSIKNNYFRSFKFPDFDDLYWSQPGSYYIGNPDLRPEDGWGTDLIVEFRPAEWFGLESSAYYQWTADSIHWVKYAGAWKPQNAGVGTFVGWDARLTSDIPFKLGPFSLISLTLSYRFLQSWLLSGDFGYADNKRIPYMPRHTFGVSLDIPWNSGSRTAAGSLLVSGHYESLRYADTGNLLALDPYVLLTITLNQRLGKRLSASAVVRNALNSLYTSFAEYPMPGITATLGIRLLLDDLARSAAGAGGP
jgi:vitamin B12 transporter